MTTLKSTHFIERAIPLGIPLAIVSGAALASGIEIASWTSIFMASLAAVLLTVFGHFVLEPRRPAYEAKKAMGTYYHLWAAASVLISLAAVSIVHFLMG
ncbi:hypothetical protein [Burkholderia cenocepacia]|uniref:hypothetical protein n=1 Tax=Burkholderia cenocepacia TaxID=95486 RepID=UPI0007613504|nr:hypothetical protein [Burkholderia cenocepacia]KWU17788.1 hypothetical protein AS149_13795 [Burkholderia cenocepacia]